MRLKRMVAILCILLLLTGCAGAQKDDAPQLMEPVAAQKEYSIVRRGDLNEKVFYNAYVEPELYYVSFESDGVVDNVEKIIGDRVQQGDILAGMDMQQIHAQKEVCEQRLKSLNALFALEDAIRQQEIRISQTQLEMARQYAGVTQQKIASLTNAVHVLSENSITDEETRLEESRADMSMLQEEINDHTHEAAAGYLYKGMEQQLYDVSRREYQEQLKQLQEKEVRNIITAPCDGIVVSNLVPYGRPVQSGDEIKAYDPLYVIADDNRKYITIPDLKESAVSQEATVIAVIDGKQYPLQRAGYDANVQSIVGKKITALTGRNTGMDIRFTCQDETVMRSLQMGDYVSVYLVERGKKNVLSALNDSIYKNADETYVIKLVDGQEVKTPVETGLYTSYETELLSGVNEGDVLLSRNLFYEAGDLREQPLQACDYLWEETINTVVITQLYLQAVYSRANSARLDQLCVPAGTEVKKGDAIAELTLHDNQSQITKLTYDKTTLAQDEAAAVAELEKLRNKCVEQKEELQRTNATDPMAGVLDAQIEYYALSIAYTKAQYSYERELLEEQLKQLREEKEKSYIRAECDGRLDYINTGFIGKMVTPNDRICSVIPKGCDVFGVFDNGLLKYGMQVKVEGTTSNNEEFSKTCHVIHAANVRQPWIDMRNARTLIAPEDGERGFEQITSSKLTVATRTYRKSYQITQNMLFEDNYGSFVYLCQDGKRIKRYVILTEFHDGKAVVLDGIDENCIVLEKGKG